MELDFQDVLARPRSLLSRIQLVVHQNPTKEDFEAERLLREVCKQYSSETLLEIVKWTNWADSSASNTDWADPSSLPALNASGQIFFGLSQIAKLVQLEREDLQSLRAYRKRYHKAAR